MEEKRIKVNYRIRTSNEDALECLINEYNEGEEDLIALFAEDEDGKIAATYWYGDQEVNAYFYDNELWDGMIHFSHELFEQKKMYIPHPEITNIQRNGSMLCVEMVLYLPWSSSEVPSIPDEEQIYIPSEGEPELSIYESRIVGVKYHTNEKQYEELDEKVMRLETAILQKEPENQNDPNAIAAYTQDGLKIGYTPKDEIESVKSIMGNNSKLDVEMSYMDFNAGSINIRIKTWVTKSLLSEKLFKLYSPIEVYRANYVYRKWGGITEKTESELFDKSKQLIDFKKFNSLTIGQQDRLAEKWLDRMTRATVENPTNPGLRMTVPLDLSVYGTSWKKINLRDEAKLSLIEAENKMIAIYVRTRRMGYKFSPEEFVEEMNLNELGETIMKRMHYIYDNNRL